MLEGLKTFEKRTLKNDIISGIIIALVSIPISMGYAQIAGLPAQYGLYGSVLPVFLFALFTSSPQYIFGVDAAPAALVGGTLTSMGIAFFSDDALHIVPVITFFVGIWLIVFRLLDFGKLTRFVSSPVMGGFITGICSTIILMQTPKLFGGQAGAGEIQELLPHIVSECRNHFNIYSLILAVFCIAVIQICAKVAPKLPIPAFIMIIAAGAQYFTSFCDIFSITTLPAVDRGLGAFVIPDFTVDNCFVGMTSGFTVALVIAAETLLAAQNFAMKNDYKIDDRSELTAYSVCNLAASFVGVCPVNGSVSRTSMNDRFGGRSQLVSVVAAGVMSLILLFFTGFISYLPVPVLTSIVVCALWGAAEFSLARKLAKSSRKELFIFIAAFAGVLIFGTIHGVVIGVMLSFLNVILRESNPPTSFLGVIPGRNHFYDLSTYAKARPIKNVIIYRFNGNLFFANVNGFVREIEEAILPDTKYIVVDAGGIGSIDSTGAQALGALYRKLKKRGVQLFLVEQISKVNEEMRTYGLSSLIESGGVRRTITDALAAVGINRPYELCTNYTVQSITDDKAILQEFEWAFGSDAQRYIELYTEKILRRACAVDPSDSHAEDEYVHLWDGISPISDHVLLDYMESKHEQLCQKYDLSEEQIKNVIENHRRTLESGGYKNHLA
ncbi:MAG: SulP family inorganic anion transporter [Clostridia bacterium]|nr:SulP family inorganic anion transporter [Clostridia bacterium]